MIQMERFQTAIFLLLAPNGSGLILQLGDLLQAVDAGQQTQVEDGRSGCVKRVFYWISVHWWDLTPLPPCNRGFEAWARSAA